MKNLIKTSLLLGTMATNMTYAMERSHMKDDHYSDGSSSITSPMEEFSAADSDSTRLSSGSASSGIEDSSLEDEFAGLSGYDKIEAYVQNHLSDFESVTKDSQSVKMLKSMSQKEEVNFNVLLNLITMLENDFNFNATTLKKVLFECSENL